MNFAWSILVGQIQHEPLCIKPFMCQTLALQCAQQVSKNLAKAGFLTKAPAGSSHKSVLVCSLGAAYLLQLLCQYPYVSYRIQTIGTCSKEATLN